MSIEVTALELRMEEAVLVTPVIPRIVIGAERNYYSHLVINGTTGGGIGPLQMGDVVGGGDCGDWSIEKPGAG